MGIHKYTYGYTPVIPMSVGIPMGISMDILLSITMGYTHVYKCEDPLRCQQRPQAAKALARLVDAACSMALSSPP